MPRLTIDNQELEVAPATSVLQAARALGLDIPSLCYHEGYHPPTSCMLCLVKLTDTGALVPSCATEAVDGMQIESETEEIHKLRRAGLELLLSDHVGDCTAPCQRACPVHLDIPRMLQQLAAGDLTGAVQTMRSTVALAGLLGRLCSQPCESACRRGRIDEPAAICQVQRFITEVGFKGAEPYLPACAESTGKHVAIVGAGPAGLAAAYELLQAGHACTLFERCARPGGTLNTETSEAELPRTLLAAEIDIVIGLGACLQLETSIDSAVALADLRGQYDAVLLALGELDPGSTEVCGVPAHDGRLRCDPASRQTSLSGVFATGSTVRPQRLLVRALADGQIAARCIDQHLRGLPLTATRTAFNVPGGQLLPEELAELARHASPFPRVDTENTLTLEQAQAEAVRCLHCECGKQTTCKLRHYAELYGAKTAKYRGRRRALERRQEHPYVTYEPGKCIQCGLCVQVAERHREPLGLTFIGRGFDVRLGVPFNGTLAEALQQAAQACAQICPTGALALRPHS